MAQREIEKKKKENMKGVKKETKVWLWVAKFLFE